MIFLRSTEKKNKCFFLVCEMQNTRRNGIMTFTCIAKYNGEEHNRVSSISYLFCDVQINVREYRRGNQKRKNPEKLAT